VLGINRREKRNRGVAEEMKNEINVFFGEWRYRMYKSATQQKLNRKKKLVTLLSDFSF